MKLYINTDNDGKILSLSEVKKEGLIEVNQDNLIYPIKDNYIFKDNKLEQVQDIRKKETSIKELKQKRTQDTQNIQVQVQDNIFAGDEESQGRLARAISVLQEGESTIWITENNGAQEVLREDLQEALKLAGQEQTKIWVEYNTSKEEL